jgi:hypothetical protein
MELPNKECTGLKKVTLPVTSIKAIRLMIRVFDSYNALNKQKRLWQKCHNLFYSHLFIYTTFKDYFLLLVLLNNRLFQFLFVGLCVLFQWAKADGPAFTKPVFTSNCDPCQGHCTVAQIIAPPASEPPLCVQRSSKAT